MEFRDIRELYEELDYWRAYTPNNMASNMLRIGNINSIKNAIASRIDVDEFREYLLEEE